MPLFTDQTGNTIELTEHPKRIVSLVPSQTELLADLGLDTQVTGITKFCIRPENWYRNKTRVGGTKGVNQATVHRLKPDLIIANKEENVKEEVKALQQHYPVWISDVATLETALDMIGSIGALTGTGDKAAAIITRIKTGFAALEQQPHVIQGNRPSAAYLIWKDPYMAAGGDTFIHDMLQRAGFSNIYAKDARYPVIQIEDIHAAGCAVLFLSSEPYPFKSKHKEALQQQLPRTKIILVDGEMFSWYGSRIMHAPGYFEELWKEVEEAKISN